VPLALPKVLFTTLGSKNGAAARSPIQAMVSPLPRRARQVAVVVHVGGMTEA
jgi:hypothetical protein